MEQRIIVYTEKVALEKTHFNKKKIIDGTKTRAKTDLADLVFSLFESDPTLSKILLMRSQIEDHEAT